MAKQNKKKKRISTSGIGNENETKRNSERRRSSGSTQVAVEQASSKSSMVDNSENNSERNNEEFYRMGREWLEERSHVTTKTIEEDPLLLRMCACFHKIHWSVVSIAVNIIAIVLFTTAVATKNWGIKSFATYDITTGLFQSCTGLNDTCYDTHTFFDAYDEKGYIMASAVICTFALIGMWMFFALAIFFLCGWFEEKQLTNGAILASYLSGLLAIVGMIMYSVSIKSLDYSLSWSFILGVLGFCVNIAAGVLMCVGRNVSTKSRKKRKAIETPIPRRPREEVQMEDTSTTRKKIWATGEDPETTVKKTPLPAGASNF